MAMSCHSRSSGTATFGEDASFGGDIPVFTQGPLSSPLHQFFQQQIHAQAHTRSAGSKRFFSNLTLLSFNFQPSQLLFLFSAEFTFLPQLKKTPKNLVFATKKFHFINLNPSGYILSQNSTWRKESCFNTAASESSVTLESGRPKCSLLSRHLHRRVARVSKREEKKKPLQCPIYALCQSCRNNSCCHQSLIFLVFDTTHRDKFGDRILHSNPEPFEHCSSLAPAARLWLPGRFGTVLPRETRHGPRARDAALCQMKLG